jgi:hypothetical protein
MQYIPNMGGIYSGFESGAPPIADSYPLPGPRSGTGMSGPPPSMSMPPPPGMPPLPPPSTGTTPPPTPAPVPTPASTLPTVTPVSAQNALSNFANSAGMQFALQQGANTLNNLYAAHGQIQSGAAAKALQSFGQNTALQNYFFPYMNYLTGQQNMGENAAAALNGVGSSYGANVGNLGQGYANGVTNINQGAANAIGQGAYNIGNAQANQAAINGYGQAGIGSAIGSGLGQIGSSFFQPSQGIPTLPIDAFGTGNNAGY